MANTLYNHARRLLLASQLTWAPTDGNPANGATDIKVALVRVGSGFYTFSPSHTSMTPVAAGIANTNAGSGTALTAMTSLVSTEDGAADANDATITSVTSGQTIHAIVIYREVNPSNHAQNIPIAFIDTATGLPIVSNGGDIIITWDNGTNRIFRP